MAAKTKARPPAKPPAAPVLEWAVAAVGLVLILGALAVIGWEAFSGGPTPPAIEVRALGAERAGAGWRLRVEARNTGGDTAADVQVEGVLTPPGGGPEETAGVTFDYVPEGGREEGALNFTSDPRQGKLELSVKGWAAP